MADLVALARASRAAAQAAAGSSGATRDAALRGVRASLVAHKDAILAANAEDLAAAAASQLPASTCKRLDLQGAKFEGLLEGLEQVERLPDPLGAVSLARRLDDGLDLFRVSCPIGVLCVIFESRPDAAVQIASLAIKTGNAVILKGGKEAAASNRALIDAIAAALAPAGLPPALVQLVSSRDEVHALLGLSQYIDLVIPRGSNALVKSIMESTRIPVMGHADGICAVYLDAAASPARAAAVVADAKAQYPGVCNAAETLLVHAEVLHSVLPGVGAALAAAGVSCRADERCAPVLAAAGCAVSPAVEADWGTEFLDLRMAVKCVDDLDAAIAHINEHGSHHTDAIVTEDAAAAEAFFARVDSAGVFHNASTRFADGFRYGFGTEVGVSTHRIHARGPVGVEGLLIYKYRLYGAGHCVAAYGSGAGQRPFLHNTIPSVLPVLPPS